MSKRELVLKDTRVLKTVKPSPAGSRDSSEAASSQRSVRPDGNRTGSEKRN